MAGGVQRLGHGAAHQAGGAHAIGQARQIDHGGHLLEAAAHFAHQMGAGAFQADLAAGDGAATQLVLQADDAVAVGLAVGQQTRQQEQAKALETVRRAVDMGQHHGQAGVRIEQNHLSPSSRHSPSCR